MNLALILDTVACSETSAVIYSPLCLAEGVATGISSMGGLEGSQGVCCWGGPSPPRTCDGERTPKHLILAKPFLAMGCA